MENAHPANTPLPTTGNYKPNDGQATPQFRQKYQSIIGTILYIMLGTRPDIAYSVTMLSRFATNPSESHWRSAIHILRYLKGMKAQKLRYDGSLSLELNPRAGLIGFSDSTWASDTADRRSITGHAFFIANGAISWTSRKQPTVALSSTEAEYMALSDASRQACWLRNFLSQIGQDKLIQLPTELVGDNHGSIFLAMQPAHDGRTKHIDVKHHFVRITAEQGKIAVTACKSEDNIADALTKILPKASYDRFRVELGLSQF